MFKLKTRRAAKVNIIKSLRTHTLAQTHPHAHHYEHSKQVAGQQFKIYDVWACKNLIYCRIIKGKSLRVCVFV